MGDILFFKFLFNCFFLGGWGWGWGYRTVGCSYVASAEKRVSYPKIRVSLGNKALNAHIVSRILSMSAS